MIWIGCFGMMFFREDHYDLLTVCDWGQRIGYYQLSGKQVLIQCTCMCVWILHSLCYYTDIIP